MYHAGEGDAAVVLDFWCYMYALAVVTTWNYLYNVITLQICLIA